MSTAPTFGVRRLGPQDGALLADMMILFGDVFAEPVIYTAARPGRSYVERLLASDLFVALVAIDGEVVGGLTAYELPKPERERSEFYIYDLAVAAEYRRRGIATALIGAVKAIAASRGASVIFIQADHGDDPAIALYSKLSSREDVLHFDILLQ